MRDETPKPCPWCGQPPTVKQYSSCDIIACMYPDCWVKPSVSMRFDRVRNTGKLIAIWNARAKGVDE